MKDRFPPKKNVCRICNSMEDTEWHHIISQNRCRKINKKLIYNRGNIIELCIPCHNETTASLIKNRTELNICAGIFSKYENKYRIRVMNIGDKSSPEECVGDYVALSISDGTAKVAILGEYLGEDLDTYIDQMTYIFKEKELINEGWVRPKKRR
jgi:hypothetical protein